MGVDHRGLQAVVGIETSHEESHVTNVQYHLALRCGQDLTTQTEVLIAHLPLEGIDNLVGTAVQHKHAVVVHLHPHILVLVDSDIEQAVVQVLHTAGATHAVIIELVAVVARESVPGGNPDIAVTILSECGDGVAAQPVFCRDVGMDSSQRLCICHYRHQEQRCHKYLAYVLDNHSH